MSYSNSYSFQETQVIRLIEYAYRIVHTIPNTISGEDLLFGTFALNLILSSWLNTNLNLWAVSKNNLLPLNKNQTEYDLPKNIIDILEVSLRTSNRQLDGTAFSSEGTASNAFDGKADTSCVETSANGYIGYDFGENITKKIEMIGITSFVNRSYTLNVQYSDDNLTWTTFLSIPETSFLSGKVQWFNVYSPFEGRYFRILETGGSILNINEIYFNNQVQDDVLSPEARQNYMSYSNKYESGTPMVYVFNKQIPTPSLTIWPTANDSYNVLVYNCSIQIQDVGSLSNSIFIPVNFYMAIVYSLAFEFAMKSKDSVSDIKLQMIQRNKEESFRLAAQENKEKYIPLTIEVDMSRYSIR